MGEIHRKLRLSLLLFSVLFLIKFQCSDGKKIPKWWMRVAQRQGPNACVVEELTGTGKEFWTECKFWLNRNICGRKTVARFECCEGFEQVSGENGCTGVKPLLNLLETAEALGATKWADYIRESGLANELQTAGAFTLFAPTNEAFDNVKSSLQSQLQSYRGNPNNPILLYHILPNKLPSEHFGANTVVETKQPGTFIRINKYSNGMNTINCGLLLRRDQQATNGIVHIIDSVLDPSISFSDNVADVILKDGRFSVLSEMLEKSGYINVLRTMQGSLTLLAPSDEAFQKLPDMRREKIINDREARLALLQNHVIPHVICESAITGEHKVRTIKENKLTFNCDITGAYVESSKLRSDFSMGSNGIVHTLDDVLLPDRAKNLVELAESRQLLTFVDLVKRSGLEETLSHTGDYTFFVPDETAWLDLDPYILEKARTDIEFAGLMLRFHGAYGRHLTNSITDNQAIMSLDEENPLRLQVWRGALGVEDARITEEDIEAQNGVIHIIDRVIFPSNESVAGLLKALPGSDTFESYTDILQVAMRQTPSVLNLGPGDESFYTFFIPTDGAIDKLGPETKASLRSRDPRVTREFIRRHSVVNMFPLTSFEPDLLYSLEGMDGNKLSIKKDKDGLLIANGIPVVGSLMSANGVIHIIDDVIKVSESFVREESEEEDIGDYDYGSGRGEVEEGRGRYEYGGRGGYENSAVESNAISYEDGGRYNYGSSGSRSYQSSSRSSGTSRRTKKTFRKTVSYAEGYNTLDELPALPQQGTELNAPKATVVPPPNSIAGMSSEPDESVSRNALHASTHNTNMHVATETNDGLLGTRKGETRSNEGVASAEDMQLLETERKLHTAMLEDVLKREEILTLRISLEKEQQRVIQQRQEELRKLDEENKRIEEENRQIEFENRRRAILGSTSRPPFLWDPSPPISRVDGNSGSESLTQHEPGLNKINTLTNYTLNTRRVSHRFQSNNAPNLNARTIPDKLTAPVTSNRTRFSYVGHSYGNDIVGHPRTKTINPLYLDKVHNKQFNFTDGGINGKVLTNGLKTTRRIVNVTRTVYSYPDPKGGNRAITGHYFPNKNKLSTKSFGNNSNRKGNDFISAYAFTGAETEYADGKELSESGVPIVATITINQARALRRLWRRKRHQMMHPKGNLRKFKRRMRRLRQKRREMKRKAMSEKE